MPVALVKSIWRVQRSLLLIRYLIVNILVALLLQTLKNASPLLNFSSQMFWRLGNHFAVLKISSILISLATTDYLHCQCIVGTNLKQNVQASPSSGESCL